MLIFAVARCVGGRLFEKVPFKAIEQKDAGVGLWRLRNRFCAAAPASGALNPANAPVCGLFACFCRVSLEKTKPGECF